jgi:DNA-binding transcriptional regulator YhcF (GntR family)
MIFAIRDLRGVTATEKLVLFALASHLPNIRVGQTRLAEETGVSRETISRCIRALVAKKIIEKDEGKNRILTIKFLLQQDGRVVTEDHNGCDTGSQLVVTEDHIKNQLKIQDKNINKKQKNYLEEFDQFYKKYPEKKGDKALAKNRFIQARKSGATFEKIMHDLECYISTKPEWKSWAYCPSWFKQMMEDKKWREEIYANVKFDKQLNAIETLKKSWQNRSLNMTETSLVIEQRRIDAAWKEATDEQKKELRQLAPEGVTLPKFESTVVHFKTTPSMRAVQ